MAHFHVAFPENIVRLGLCILIPSAHPDSQPVGPGLQFSFHPAAVHQIRKIHTGHLLDLVL